MKTTLVDEYKKIYSGFLKGGSERERITIYREIDQLTDDTEDLETQFLEADSSPGYPRYWIAVLRIIRYSLNLKHILMEPYDLFVSTYQKLNSVQSLKEDQSHLLTEIGEFLYTADETIGQHERCISKTLEVMHQCLLEEYGVSEPTDSVYSYIITNEASERINPHIHDLYNLISEIQKETKIMSALSRMIRLLG